MQYAPWCFILLPKSVKEKAIILYYSFSIMFFITKKFKTIVIGVTNIFDNSDDKSFIIWKSILLTISIFINIKSFEIKNIKNTWYTTYIKYFNLREILLLFLNTFRIAKIKTNVMPIHELIVLFKLRLLDIKPRLMYTEKSINQPMPLMPTNFIAWINKFFNISSSPIPTA